MMKADFRLPHLARAGKNPLFLLSAILLHIYSRMITKRRKEKCHISPNLLHYLTIVLMQGAEKGHENDQDVRVAFL